ncbi:MAG: iron-containing redox enzyme family protein [Myxococcaceae bacterium]|nr:iron-containing redox enzyme family protein [Myxococcaceae bacterium]
MLKTADLLSSRALAPLWQGLQASSPYQPTQAWLLDSPYRRPTDLSTLPVEALSEPVRLGQLFTQRSLVLNRLLFNIYEQNNLYLPQARFSEADTEAFHRFYAPDFMAANAFVRPAVERACFQLLDDELTVDGPWTMEHLEAYCQKLLTDFEATPSEVCRRVDQAAFPKQAARMFLIQVAPDFLSEASQMARALPGNFGPVHSELTKIFIDEFGYGVFQHKHSTLFERTLESVGLNSRVHAYYYWYLPSSLLMTSYFHWITSNKPRWFEYVGALYWIEAVVPHFNRQFSKLLKAQFGQDTDTEYFDEHVGIDLHHRRMALDKLIRPTVQLYGDSVIPAMVRGIEASRLLGDLAERDFFAQMDFCEALHGGKAAPEGPVDLAGAAEHPKGWFLEPRVCDVETVLAVAAGEVEVDGGYLTPRVLRTGEAVAIPAGRMVGARVASEGARLLFRPRGEAAARG